MENSKNDDFEDSSPLTGFEKIAYRPFSGRCSWLQMGVPVFQQPAKGSTIDNHMNLTSFT